MDTDEPTLREKALLLVARERELVALRNKHLRLLNWLTLSHSLPQIVRRDHTLSEIGAALVSRIISLIKLQKVQLFEVRPDGLRVFGKATLSSPPLDASTSAWLSETRSGLFNQPENPQQSAIAGLLRLHRVLWYRVDAVPDVPVLLLGGFDEQRAACYPPFDHEDAEHFAHAGQHFEALLTIVLLVNELEQDKARLEQFNAELERRVNERTADLARAHERTSQALAELRDKDQRLSEDLAQARAFQQGTLPTLPRTSWFEVDAVYRPVEVVGGDIYDVALIAPDRCRLFIADATGHGVQASLRTISIKSAYDRIKHHLASPAAVLVELNRTMLESYAAAEIMCTACCFDLIRQEKNVLLRYTNAAHPGIVVWSGGRVLDVYHHGPFLGVSSDITLETQDVLLSPCDTLLVFTDGLGDQPDESGHTMDLEQRFARALSSPRTLHELLDAIMSDFDAFRGAASVNDDITILAARLRDGGA